MPENKDFIDRRTDNVATIFGLAKQDAMALMLVISICLNVWLTWENIQANKDWSKVVIEEVRKQAPQIIEKEVEKKVEPMRNAVDNSTNNINEFIDKRGGKQ